jgi:hypothetical protein
MLMNSAQDLAPRMEEEPSSDASRRSTVESMPCSTTTKPITLAQIELEQLIKAVLSRFWAMPVMQRESNCVHQ